MLAMFALGFSSGFPFYVIREVLKAWLTDADGNGVADSLEVYAPDCEKSLEECLAVLETPEFAGIFGPGSRAEVPVAGVVDGPDGPRTAANATFALKAGE